MMSLFSPARDSGRIRNQRSDSDPRFLGNRLAYIISISLRLRFGG